MILGLGVSHQPINQALGIGMSSPTDTLRSYATQVAGWLRGGGPAAHLQQQPANYPVPIHLGAMTSTTVDSPAKSPTVSCLSFGQQSALTAQKHGRHADAQSRLNAASWR